ncbi:hypothetical protein LCGC14_0370450 [marine sediment metagenome]|uniref:Uncharacterized protein n=1 Tax=marine sediment metagenome TaxID=412755 RepID=A0A0F9TB27_9ZZZZ|nr:hypothetical protein [Maribacter sp.]HDZ04882.1 hypothetical protein [Maribacter sp.]
MTVLLRTLTKKSILGFGKFADCKVGDLMKISIKEIEYLVWVYYHMSMISYHNDILIELGIIEDLQIDKPGKEMKNFYRWKIDALSDIDRLYLYSKTKHWKKILHKKISMADHYIFSPKNLTLYNHNK